MEFVYKPEGAEPRRWEFEPDKLMSPEAEAIERHTGMTFPQWVEKVLQGSMLSIHALLFVMLKRTNPTLKWDEVQFSFSEWDLELNDEEKREARNALLEKAKDGPLSFAEQAQLEDLGPEPQPSEPEPADENTEGDDPKED